MGQQFVSNLHFPWALVRCNGGGQPGKRAPTTVVWLEYRRPDGGFDGGPVWWNRRKRCWWFTFKHQKTYSREEILHVFPIPKIHSSVTSPWNGPSQSMIRKAKQALPVLEA
jgi:hypothetical protein